MAIWNISVRPGRIFIVFVCFMEGQIAKLVSGNFVNVNSKSQRIVCFVPSTHRFVLSEGDTGAMPPYDSRWQ